MLFRKLITAATVTVCFSFTAAHSQTPQPPSDASGLALEIRYLKERPPAYQTVLGSIAPKKGSWYAAFDRIAGWQLPAGELSVRAVKVLPYLKGETINISVSVLRGNYHDVEDYVGFYKARENETLVVKELEGFGVVPFEIKIIRVNSHPETPTTLNKTQSVAIVGIEPAVATLPRYNLTLQNSSNKSVIALSIKVMQQGRSRLSGLPARDYGVPLIKAQDFVTLHQPLATNAVSRPGGFEPSPALSQQLVIDSLIFEDGSFEGDTQPAAMYISFVVGRRIELRRLMPLLEKAFRATKRAAAAEQLQSELKALSFDADEAEVASLLTAFPLIEKRGLLRGVDTAIHRVRRELIDQLDRLYKSEAGERELDEWVVTTRELYSKWLSRLEVVKVGDPK